MNNNKSIKRHKKSRLNQDYFGWIFCLPFIAGFLLYYAGVLFDSVKYSFSTVKLGTEISIDFCGFDNFIYALREHPTFLRTAIESIGSMLTNIPVILIFSLFIAVILNKKIPGRTFFRTVFFIPVIVSVGLIETADAGNTVLSSLSSMENIETGAEMAGGVLNFADIQRSLQSLNFSPQLISYVASAVENIINVVNQSGVQIIIFMVGLQSISPSIYESALVEGATGWEVFWKITFPMITPMILVNLFFSVIDALTRSSSPIMILIKQLGLVGGKTGQASAMSWIYFIFISLILAVMALILKKAFYSAEHQNR